MDPSSSHVVNMSDTNEQREIGEVFSADEATASTFDGTLSGANRRSRTSARSSRTTLGALFGDSSDNHRPPSPSPPPRSPPPRSPPPRSAPPQLTIEMIVQAIIIASRRIDLAPERQNKKFALFASFMLMISTAAFVLSFEQAQKWQEDLIRMQQQQQQQNGGNQLKKEHKLITESMAAALAAFFVGLVSAMILMVTGTFSYTDMRRSPYYLAFTWFLIMSTLVSPSLPVVGIIGAAAAIAVYIVMLIAGGIFAARPLIENYQHED